MKINSKTLKNWLFKFLVIMIVIAMILSVFVVIIR